jgi:hypothetical protein
MMGEGDYTFPAQDFGYSTSGMNKTFTVTNIGDAPTGALHFAVTDTSYAGGAFDVTNNYFTGTTTLDEWQTGSLTITPKENLPVGSYTALVEIYDTRDGNYISFNVFFTVKDYALITSSNAGTVTVTPTQSRYGAGEVLAYEVTPANAANYYFDEWTQTGGAALSVTDDAAGGSFTMPANDVTLTAVFLPRPTVTSVSPAGTGAPPSGELIITFSEEMNPSIKGAVSLTGGAGSVNADKDTWLWSNGYKTLSVPYSGLAWTTEYTVATSGFRNDHASNLGISVSSSNTFTTRAQTEETVTYQYFLPSASQPFITISEGKNVSSTYTYDLLQIPYYAAASATITNSDGNNVALATSGTTGLYLDIAAKQIKNINPARGATTLKITLASTLTSVTIKSVNDGDAGATLQTITIPNVEINTAFTFPAPLIDGYQLQVSPAQSATGTLPNNGGLAVTDAASNIITIHYIPLPAGNTVYNYEIPENWVTTFDVDAFKASPATYEHLGRRARLIAQYTAKGNLGAAIPHGAITGFTYSSSNPASPVITANTADAVYFFYTPKMVNITINKYLAPSTTTPVPGTSPEVKAYQEGDYVTIDAPVIQNYTLYGSAAQSITIPSSATSVAFYYNENAKIAVSVVYEDISGNALGSVNSVTGYVGSTFTAAPATFNGYTFAQAYTNDGTDYVPTAADPVVITVSSNANLNRLKFTYTDVRHTVTVTNSVNGDTVIYKVANGEDLQLTVPFISDFVPVSYKVDAQADTPVTAGSVTLSNVAGDKSVVFTYQTVEDAANASYVTLTIRGVAGAAELYSYDKRVFKSATAITLTDGADVFDVPGYELVTGQSHSVTPNIDRIVTFNYASRVTTVTIKMVKDGDTSTNVASPFAVSATVNGALNYNAPYVPGYRLTGAASGNANPVLANGASVITFTYAQITSKVTIVHREHVTGTAADPIIKVTEVSSPALNTPTQVLTPDLTDIYYTARQPDVSYLFNGTDPVSVDAFYDKQTVTVDVTTVDDETGLVDLGEGYQVSNVRKGDIITVAAPAIADYQVAGASSQSVDTASTLSAEFRYKDVSAIGVTVNVRVGSATGELVHTYLIAARTGDPVTVDPDTVNIAGYAYYSGSGDNRLTVTSGDGDDIRVIVEDIRKTVTVTTDPATTTDTHKVVLGASSTVTVPYMAGYVLEKYKIDGEEATSVTGISITVPNVTADTDVLFTYQTTEDAVNAGYVIITIEGVSDGETHYSYMRRVAKDVTPITLADGADVFKVPGFKLDDGQEHDVTPDASKTVTFTYSTLATTVTVKTVRDGAPETDVAASFLVPSTVDAVFSYNAPNVPGYYLTSASSIGVVPKVAAGGASELVFTYSPIASRVTIIAKEDSTAGRVILVSEVASPQVGTQNYSTPDLTADFYTTATPTVSISYDGINSKNVEVYYTKELIDIPLAANNLSTSETLIPLVSELAAQRRGEAVTVPAPGVSQTGFALVGASERTVIASGSAVTFDYVSITSDEVLVKAVVQGGGAVLQSYVIKGTSGDNVSALPPTLLGWRTNDGESSAKVGTDWEIVFEYVKNVVTVLIITLDDKSAPLATPVPVEVANGGNYTAYAPHFDGYLLTSPATDVFTSLTSDDSATFTYKAVVNLATLEVRYVDSKDDTTVIKTQAVGGYYVGQQFTVTDVAPEAFNTGGRKYKLDDSKNYSPVTLLTQNTVDVFYKDDGAENVGGGGGASATATLTIMGVDYYSETVIFRQTIKCIVGSRETIIAPYVEGYSSAGISGLMPREIVIVPGENYVTFLYASNSPDNDGGVSDKIKDTLETVEHIKYINGYEDGTVKPDAAITRAEVAAIFFRLIRDGDKNVAIAGTFNDVESDAWYSQAVNYLAKHGILTGYEDGSFRPREHITRAEFAAIASRFDDVQQGISNAFVDVDNQYWAYDYIMSAYVKGWISGYPGDVFKPNHAITRAEVVKIVNKMLGRRLSAADVPDELRTLYSDLKTSHWAFGDVIESSVEHEYDRDANGNEMWTSNGGRADD